MLNRLKMFFYGYGLAHCPRDGHALNLELWPPLGASCGRVVYRCSDERCTYLVMIDVPEEKPIRGFP
jgi:hypothetical protein